MGSFLFASTNLVIELGIVMWLILGPKFVLANFIGGIALIILLSTSFETIVPSRVINSARNHLKSSQSIRDPACGMEVNPQQAISAQIDGVTEYFCSESCKKSYSPETQTDSIYSQVTSRKGWSQLASKQWSEWKMLGDEILAGFILASLIDGFIPKALWNDIFTVLSTTSAFGIVLASVIAVLIGILTFVCSVGNVPLAAVLWVNGLPFGSVLSFIYADLVVPPILVAYREYYGTNFAVILSILIIASAIVVGLFIQLLFSTTGQIPTRPTTALTTEPFGYRSVLNILATVLFVSLYTLQK